MPLLVRRHVRQLLVLAFVVFKCIPDAKYKFCSCTEATLGECQKIGTKLTDRPVLMTCCVSKYLIFVSSKYQRRAVLYVELTS